MTTPTADANGEQLQAHLDAMDARDSAARREQTAATLLAALINAHVALNADRPGAHDIPTEYYSKAVMLADELRAELRKTEGA